MMNLGNLLAGQSKYDEGELIHLKCFELRKVKLGADHPHTLQSMGNLGALYYKQNKYMDKAEAFFVKCLELRR